jgi:undecaprenyl-diphosphatase
MVEPQLPKLVTGVRFPSPALSPSEASRTAPPPVAPPRPVVFVLQLASVLLLVAVVTSTEGMSTAAAVLLGVIEGLTEWLPISSTGHLAVTQELLGIGGPAADSYAIAIQAGAILAVLGLYRARFASVIAGIRGRDPEGRRLLIALLVASLPAAITGLLLEDVIKANLFGIAPVIVAWFLGGIAILVVARRRRDVSPDAGRLLDTLRWRGALIIGLAQILALWPGTSRSLVTILAGTAIGLAVPAAVEFSFLLGFIVLGGATAYETLSSGAEMVAAYGYVTPLVGLVVAFVASVVAMRWMVAYLNRRGLGIFGWYRIAIAVVAGALLATGTI